MWWQPKAWVHQALSSLWLRPEIKHPNIAPLMLSHCRQQRICFSKCWAVCPISVNTDDSFWKHGKTKSERWDQHNSRSRKLKRMCWNSFGRWVTQHLHFLLWFFWTLTEIFGHVHGLFPLFLPTTPCLFHFSTCMWFGFYLPASQICQASPKLQASSQPLEWSFVHHVLSLCCMRVLWLLPLFLS